MDVIRQNHDLISELYCIAVSQVRTLRLYSHQGDSQFPLTET